MEKTIKVCGTVGSLKKNGNVDLIVAQVLKGVKKNEKQMNQAFEIGVRIKK